MTRLDGVLGTATGMRTGVTAAAHHARHRMAFGRKLADQRLMASVLADLAIESEATTMTAFRLAGAGPRVAVMSSSAALEAFLAEPRTVDEMVAHRFVYRPHVESVFAESVERRTSTLHLDRMLARGEAAEVEPGKFQRVGS